MPNSGYYYVGVQAIKRQPHGQAHFILLVPHKIKELFFCQRYKQNKKEETEI